MKRLLYIAAFGLAAALAAGSCGDRRARIDAQIDNLPDGTVYLVRYDGNVETIDSTRSEAGVFSFRQPDAMPDIYYVRFAGLPGVFFPVAAEGVALRVTGNFDSRDEIRVTGSPGNDAMAQLRAAMRPYDILNRAIALDLRGLDPAGPDSLLYRDLVGKRDSVGLLLAAARRDFVRAHRDNIVSAMLAAGELTDSTTRTQVDSLLSELDPAMPDNAPLERLRRRAK